jgi:hypothetical protein
VEDVYESIGYVNRSLTVGEDYGNRFHGKKGPFPSRSERLTPPRQIPDAVLKMFGSLVQF